MAEQVNPSEGRVPLSWNECADWVEIGGTMLSTADDGKTWTTTKVHPTLLRATTASAEEMANWRLGPPPNLVAAPEGMDGGGYVGEGRHVPEGWEWRIGPNQEFLTDEPLGNFVQCRPPVRVRAVVEVPLTRLVGRTIEGCEDAVTGYRAGCLGVEWLNSRGGWFSFPAGSLDLDTGRVRVYAEGDEK